jgi:phage gpG-like protein
VLLMFEFELDDVQLDLMLEFWSGWWGTGRPLQLAADSIAEDAEERIRASDRGPDGRKWARWSPAYAATRGPQHKLLFADGDLADSLEADRNGDKYEVGSDLDYALAQQFGTLDGRLKPRPYVGTSKKFLRELTAELAEDFDGGWLAVRA